MSHHYRQDSYIPEGPRHRPPHKSSFPIPSRLGFVGGVLRNKELLRNAGSIVATTGVTSLLGFAFWLYSARMFSTQAVGYGTAAVATMMLLGTVGQFGLDTLLIGELPRGGNRGGLTMAACIAAFVVSFILGFGWALISLAFGNHFIEINRTIGQIALFSFGTAITGATLVFDAATIGLMRGGLQLFRNSAVSIIKMACLLAVAMVWRDQYGVGILLSWVLGTVIGLLPVAVVIKRSGSKVLHGPDWENLWHLRRLALAHNWLNLAINIPVKLAAVLVAVVVSPTANGAYYIAAMVSQFLLIVPRSLSMVLFAVVSAAPEKFAEKLRFVIRMALVIGIPAGLAMGLSSHYILAAFGSKYALLATGPLWLLIAGYIPGLPNSLYITIARARGRFNQATITVAVFAAIRMAALVVGGEIDGLYGLSYGMLAVIVVQAVILAPSVLRNAYGSVAVRSAADAVTGEHLRQRPAALTEQIRLQQEAGLASLMALATRVAPTAPTGPSPSVNAQGADPLAWMALTRQQPEASARRRHRRSRASSVTRLDRSLGETTWWPDIDETTFHSRQEAGMTALISLATQAAKF